MVVPFRKIKICKHQCFSDVVQGALQHFIHFITSLSYQLGFHTIALIFTYQSFSKQQQRRNIRNSPLLYRIFGEIILEHVINSTMCSKCDRVWSASKYQRDRYFKYYLKRCDSHLMVILRGGCSFHSEN